MKISFQKFRIKKLIDRAKKYRIFRNYPAAIKLYERLIAKGSAQAMASRAEMHYHGQGGPIDYPAAIGLYEQSIDKGNAEAMVSCAYMYQHGQGCPIDYLAAIDLYDRAIAQGNAQAMSNRAYMHQHGQGGQVDYPAAIALYEQAIVKGNINAVGALASLLNEQFMVIENVHAVTEIDQHYLENPPNRLLMYQNDWQSNKASEKISQEIDEKNKALDFQNHFNEKVLTTYEESNIVSEINDNDVVNQQQNVYRN
jgi:hypothetical protein